MSEFCIFCNIVKNGSDLRQDTVLYEDEHFFIVPALGALLAGYILLISKDHIGSMCFLSKENKEKLKVILEKLSAIYLARYGFTPLLFEHGATYNEVNKSACCVDHAHIHVVPHQFRLNSELKSSLLLKKTKTLDDFFELGHMKPYLLFIDNSSEISARALDEDAAPSQVFRKWVAKDMGIASQWDWRIHRFEDNVYKTIIDMGSILYKANLTNRITKIKNIYYGRAMDGLCENEIALEYEMINRRLEVNDMNLVNPFTELHSPQCITKESGTRVAYINRRDMDKADCVVINLSIKGHPYFGCIDEIIAAHQRGLLVIVIVGDSGYDSKGLLHYRASKIVKTIDDAFELLINDNK